MGLFELTFNLPHPPSDGARLLISAEHEHGGGADDGQSHYGTALLEVR